MSWRKPAQPPWALWRQPKSAAPMLAPRRCSALQSFPPWNSATSVGALHNVGHSLDPLATACVEGTHRGSPGTFCQGTRGDLHLWERRRKSSRQQFLQVCGEGRCREVAKEGMERCNTQQLRADSAGGEMAEKVLPREPLGTSATCKAKPGRTPSAICTDPV